MYKIPGIVSLLQKKKQVLNSDDVVTIGCQIWKNKDNPALLKCVCPEKDPNYVFDPYNPDLPPRIKRKYKKSKEIQHGTSTNEAQIDLESGISNKSVSPIKQRTKYKESGHDINPKTESFWTDLANVVFGANEVKIEKNNDHNNMEQPQPYHQKYKEVRVQYSKNEYIENPTYHRTYNNYGAQLNSINIV